MQYTLAMSLPSLPFARHSAGAGTMSARWSWVVRRENSAGGVNATRAAPRRSMRHARRAWPGRPAGKWPSPVPGAPVTAPPDAPASVRTARARAFSRRLRHILAAPPTRHRYLQFSDSLMRALFAPSLYGSSDGSRNRAIGGVQTTPGGPGRPPVDEQRPL